MNSTSSGQAFARTILNETGVNTAVFTGVITLSSDTTTGSTLEASERDDIEMCYEAHPLLQLTGCDLVSDLASEGTPLGLARLTATVDLATSGDVSITDVLVTPDDLVNFPFSPITHIAEISFSNGRLDQKGMPEGRDASSEYPISNTEYPIPNVGYSVLDIGYSIFP